jgi:Rps23 Pro-64 3,4-dihydroxylase Tpa1-like proline 4-hydroxylase
MKPKKQCILKRMKEIWQMWLVINLFYKERISLAYELAREQIDNKIHDVTVKKVNERAILLAEEIGEEISDANLETLIAEAKEESKTLEKYLRFELSDEYNKEALVKRDSFVDRFLLKHCNDLLERSREQSVDERCNNQELHQKKIEINSIIRSCIDKEKPYLKLDEENTEHIYLTPEGKKFAGIDGLLKAEILELNVITSVIIAIIGTAAATNFSWVVKITGYISPWW